MTETVQKPLNIEEAAQFLGYKKSYIYNLCHKRKLPFYKPGGKVLVFRQSDLEKFLYRNRQSADFELAEKAEALING
ncbi:MAG: helix-turn-helix domain-containing protein [Treponema sp.]|jgi:excisionase family DNA binding protein|nr:helix-turn-helix domain-containing protein [Treponema sp.]